jgi:glutamate dehydrogenase
MGMRIIGERLFEISTIDNEIVYISEFMVEYPNAKAALDSTIKAHFIDALLKIWKGYAENDRFNYLALSIGLKWEEIRIIRAYSKYLKQIGFSLSESYIQSTFEKYPVLAKNIVNLFMSKFNPKIVSNNKYSKIKRELNKLLKELDGVDQERIVKIYINLIEATVRVNLFKLKNKSDAFAIKIQSNLINILPLPKPKYEIFIFSERVEGIHLRADKVARGGIRWSNRIDDFRTEILGLMKAQNGKNSLIVPAGSKGGFIAKKLDLNMSREEIDNEVIYCYKQFISGLLDLTDNLIKDKVIKPTNVICYDEDDPYLVVAADRGTASFSDIANDLAANKYKFWLQDAFASGGSAGYDHKKMGITAKGAWQSFVWHAKEINLNINKPFTVLGIGGMAGDVFGNGMLLSKQIQLIAAFDHSYIFIDPNPDAEISFKERQRMFGVKNVNWIDYNKKLLSKGGEIYTRSSKYVEISNEAKKRFGLNKTKFGPDELINALLSAKFDLLWNGGIGTYVKSSKETNSKVGDHSNDSLRINGSNVNCKIIAEGGNLGLTQLGRIEYELIGGVVNTDFIDNSAGVDCSDHEVNIKIFLNQYLQNGQITYFDRNKLLVKMTQDVSKLVLQNTIHQNIFISLEMLSLPKYIYLYEKFIDYAEQEGVLDPEVEYLPSKQTILNRLSTGGSLTRPEMAVLFSYSKIILQSQILKTDIVNSLNTAEFLNEAFPDIMLKELLEDKLLSGGSLWNHPLRKEIIATHISNSFIHELGISFIVELNEETNKNIEDIVSAYIISRKIFNIKEILLAIDKRYSDLNAKEILFIHKSIRQFTKRCVKWLLRNNVYINKTDDQKNKLNKFIDGVNSLLSEMPYIAKGKVYDEYGMFLSKLNTISLPKHIIKEISLLNFSYAALNIVHASQKSGKNIRLFAELYFITSEKMGVYWLKNLISELNIETKWDIASSYSLKGKLDEVQRVISLNVYNNLNLKSGEVEKVFNDWFLNNKNQIKSWTRLMADLSKRKKVGFTVVYTLINELERVAQFLKELK